MCLWIQHDDVAMEPSEFQLCGEASKWDKGGYNLKRNGNEDYEGNVVEDDGDEDDDDGDGEDVGVERFENSN